MKQPPMYVTPHRIMAHGSQNTVTHTSIYTCVYVCIDLWRDVHVNGGTQLKVDVGKKDRCTIYKYI